MNIYYRKKIATGCLLILSIAFYKVEAAFEKTELIAIKNSLSAEEWEFFKEALTKKDMNPRETP